jgi:hypothetical protein
MSNSTKSSSVTRKVRGSDVTLFHKVKPPYELVGNPFLLHRATSDQPGGHRVVHGGGAARPTNHRDRSLVSVTLHYHFRLSLPPGLQEGCLRDL